MRYVCLFVLVLLALIAMPAAAQTMVCDSNGENCMFVQDDGGFGSGGGSCVRCREYPHASPTDLLQTGCYDLNPYSFRGSGTAFYGTSSCSVYQAEPGYYCCSQVGTSCSGYWIFTSKNATRRTRIEPSWQLKASMLESFLMAYPGLSDARLQAVYDHVKLAGSDAHAVYEVFREEIITTSNGRLRDALPEGAVVVWPQKDEPRPPQSIVAVAAR